MIKKLSNYVYTWKTNINYHNICIIKSEISYYQILIQNKYSIILLKKENKINIKNYL